MARWAESIWLERGCFARDHRQSLALRDAGKTAGAILRGRKRPAGVVWLSGESGGGPDAGGRLFAGVDRRAFPCQPAGCRATLRLSDHPFPPPQRRGLRGRGPTLRAGGAAVLGRSGRGTAEYLGVSGERLIQTITLSKAFGVFGGAILGTRALRARMIARSRSFSGSTPMPLPLVCAALAAVKLLQTDRGLRRRLADKIHYVRSALREGGFPYAPAPSPI